MEEHIRFVNASLKIVFEQGSIEDALFMKEYYSLLMLNDDPLGMWLKSPKVRKESEESDQVLLMLLKDLHRKVDALTQLVKNEGSPYLPLAFEGNIEAIGHNHIRLDTSCLEEGKLYYSRIDMPTFPRRFFPIFFEALSQNVGKITLMHEDDEKEWSAYMVACERVMIRQMKGNQNEY